MAAKKRFLAVTFELNELELIVYFMVSDHWKLNGMLIIMIGCVWTPNLGVSKMAETQKFVLP